MSSGRKSWLGISAGLVLVSGLIFGTARLPEVVSQLSYAAESGRAEAAREQLADATNLSQSFKNVAKALRPSVVTVTSVIRTHNNGQPQAQRPEVPEEFRRFFGDDIERFFDFPGQQQQPDLEQRGLGSGVIISAQGHIVTNNHVVQNATEVKVTLSDRRDLVAKVIGTDAKTDLAVLKVEADDLMPVQFGDSDALEVGDWVLAIGNPFELQHTVTAGIISAKGRVTGILGREGYEDFLQTDAAINPGNSGGPLVNLKGEVIGINTAIASRNGFYMGVGFAIPSKMVRSITESIIRQGRVQRGQLGALIGNLDSELAKSFGYSSTEGVLINDVVAASPAEKAGLKPGDIVTHLNGKPIQDRDQLRRTIASMAPGTEVELSVFRSGENQKVTVKLAELTDQQPSLANNNESPAAAGETNEKLGLTVEPLTPELAQRLGYKEEVSGVVVTEVAPNSVAARLGIEQGDVVLAIGDKQINGMEDFKAALNEQSLEEGIRLQLMHEGVRRFVYLKVGS